MLERGMMVANKLGIGATNGKGMGIVVIKAAENTEKDGWNVLIDVLVNSNTTD